jgi:hypothetical protein
LFKKFFGRFSQDMGIDLGTANTLVHVRGRGVVLREPSVVAMNRETHQVQSVGEAAKQMVGAHAFTHRGDSSAQRWRHRRLRNHRTNAASLHSLGARRTRFRQPARHGRHSQRHHRSGESAPSSKPLLKPEHVTLAPSKNRWPPRLAPDFPSANPPAR